MEVIWVLVFFGILFAAGIWYGKRTGDPSRRTVRSKLRSPDWSAGSTPDMTGDDSDGGGCGGGD